MKQSGRGPVGIIIVIAIVLVASLGGLIGYSKLNAQNDAAYEGVLGISTDTGKTVLYNNGEITDIPDNAVIVGGMTTTWGMLSDSLADSKSGEKSSEPGVTPEGKDDAANSGNQAEDDSGLKQGEGDSSTDTDGQEKIPDTGAVEDSTQKSIEAFKDSFIESASTALAYFENRQDLISFLGDNIEGVSSGSGQDAEQGDAASGSGEGTEDQEETVEFLTVYYQGTSDRSVTLIQERLMILGFMENA